MQRYSRVKRDDSAIISNIFKNKINQTKSRKALLPTKPRGKTIVSISCSINCTRRGLSFTRRFSCPSEINDATQTRSEVNRYRQKLLISFEFSSILLGGLTRN